MEHKALLQERQEQIFGEMTDLKNKRNPSDSDRVRYKDLEKEFLDLEQEIRLLSYAENPRSKPLIDLEGNVSGTKKIFRSFGEQMLAIAQAGRGQSIDSRLLQVRAASGLSETVPSDGGFLVQQDFSSEIIKSAFEAGNISNLVPTVTISGNASGIKINAIAETSRATGSRWGGLQAYWLAEAATKLPSKPAFRQMELSLKKLVCLCYSTDELLSDAALLDQVLRQGFGQEIGFMLDDAILAGTGVGQCLGVLASNCLVSVTRTTTGTITIADIANVWARALNPEKAVWLASSTVYPTLYQMGLTIGATSTPAFMPAGGISGTPYNTLFGRPIITTEHNPVLGTKGDLVLFNPQWYILAMKSGGTKFDVSMHVRFLQDESVYRAVLRVDGQPLLAAPIQPFKSAAGTVSPFVCIAT